jgi:hypothetical protein
MCTCYVMSVKSSEPYTKESKQTEGKSRSSLGSGDSGAENEDTHSLPAVSYV